MDEFTNTVSQWDLQDGEKNTSLIIHFSGGTDQLIVSESDRNMILIGEWTLVYEYRCELI
jgi:hypothetical protein